MKWNAQARTGIGVGVGIILAILLVDAGLLWRVLSGPLNGVTFVCALAMLLSLPAIAFLAYRLYDLAHLRYEFDRNRLVIISAAVKQIIPMDSIERIVDGSSHGLKVRMHSLTWPGCQIGSGEVEGIGLTLFYGTMPPEQQTIVVTPTLAYGISTLDEGQWDVFRACQRLGSTTEVHQQSLRSAYVHWPIWQDRVAQRVLLLSVLMCAALFAVLCFRYPHLPNLLPMHYDISGQVDRIAPRDEVFVLPVIGLIAWAANGLVGALCYRRERIAAYLAWSGSLLVQVFVLLALWNVVK
jgi:hypothetical protein